MADIGSLETRRVSHIDTRTIPLLIQGIMLLRPTSQDRSNIIRIRMMSTKMEGLSRLIIVSGIMETGQVSHTEICIMLLLRPGILLLRRTSKMFIYYTDEHNVDEDMTAIFGQGGGWNWNENIGMMNRYVQDFPSGMFDVVASRLIYLS